MGPIIRLDIGSVTRGPIEWTSHAPKGTWRRTMKTDMKETGYEWNNINGVVNAKHQGTDRVAAL